MTNVTIIGGGLAGMMAALRLAEQGCQVSIYDSSHRMGGKAGANQHGADFDEHGYHIFPEWYLNTWQLVEELHIRQNFVDCSDFKQLRLGEFPKTTSLRNITSSQVGSILGNLFSGVLPVYEMVLFFYAALDLMVQPYSYRAYLDQITVNGFVRSRFYRTEQVALQFQDLMLKGISCPAYEVSAMTMRNVLRYWVRYPVPMYRILKGDLQQFYIDPFRQKLESLGCQIHLEQALERIHTHEGKVTHLTLRDLPSNESYELDVERVIVAIPVEKMSTMVDDALYASAPSLDRLAHLNARAMAALNIYFKRKLPNMPKAHTNLIGSRYGLSFIDVSQTWAQADKTVLNIIASDSVGLLRLSADQAIRVILEDLQAFIPSIDPADIEKMDFQPHLIEPLFMNDSGAWHYRPDMLSDEEPLRKELPNLYLAGDYCRSHVDLVCMEGALTTGLRAAEALRRDVNIGTAIPILVAEYPSIYIYKFLAILLMPVAVIAKLILLLRQGKQDA